MRRVVAGWRTAWNCKLLKNWPIGARLTARSSTCRAGGTRTRGADGQRWQRTGISDGVRDRWELWYDDRALIDVLQIDGERMTTNTTAPLDDAIRAAAIAKGYSDASVVTQKVQDRP